MQRVIIHIVFWIVFFFIWKRLTYFYISSEINQFLFTSFDVTSIILAFYTIYLLIAPKLFLKNKIGFIASFISAIIVSGLIMTVLMHYALNDNLIAIKFNFTWNYNDLVINRFFIVFLGAIAGLIAKLSFDWIKNKQRIDQLEKENTIAELNLLKAQINPHFLFNSLNGIYVQIDSSSEKAKESLHTFSQLLRYQLYECSNNTVLLSKEIEYIACYVELQKSRREDNYIVTLNTSIDGDQLLIAPLILITFVENAFKHVSDYIDRDNEIEITITAQKGILNMIVTNTTCNTQSSVSEAKGIGLENVKRRLTLLYPDLHELWINHTGTMYEVNLKLQLHEA